MSSRFGVAAEQEENLLFLFHLCFSLVADEEFLLQSPVELGGVRSRDSSSLALKFESGNAGTPSGEPSH